MKYLFIIFGLVATTLIISFFLRPDKVSIPEGEIAVTINGHNISNETLATDKHNYGYHETRNDLYDSVITREILIQEAQRQEIDKEENFRKALKQFYENSLVKILIDRKNKEIAAPVSDEDVSRYVKLLGQNISFTRLDAIPLDQAEVQSASGLTNTAVFDDLAEPLRLLLASLEPGEFGIRFDTGSEKYAIRLDNITSSHVPSNIDPDRQQIKEMISEFKREQILTQWLTSLKAKAKIQIHN